MQSFMTVKPGTKAKVSATDQFFIYLGWFRDGFTITMISWLFHTPESPVSRYHMNKFTFFPLWVLLYGQAKIKYQKQCLKHSELCTLLVDALKTEPKYFVKILHHCPLKAVFIKGISIRWSNKCYQWVLRRLYFRPKFVRKTFVLHTNLWEDNDSITEEADSQLIKSFSHWTWNWIFLYSSQVKVSC